MNQPEHNQLDLFEQTVAGFIDDLLRQPVQPSASELLASCVDAFGASVREDIKGAVCLLLSGSTLPRYQRGYLQHLIDDRSLEKAIAGGDDCHDYKAINTGIDTLVAGSIEYRGSKGFQELIDFMGRFREYAPYNNMLVRIQNPSCRFYATAVDWKKRFERHIKEDARPLLILAPMHPVMLVYDVDQTDGKELPESFTEFSKFHGEWDETWLNYLTQNANRYKIRIDYKELGSSLSGFATYASRGSDWKMRIAIHDQLDGPSRFGVLCHELAHIFLGHLGGDKDLWWPSRINLDHHSIEIEAEATAFIVTQQLGLQGSSAAYVSSHLQSSTDLPAGVSLDNLAKVSGKLSQMSKGLVAEPKPKKEKQERKK